MIVCRTLGPVEVTVDGSVPPSELLYRKNLALLIYLARSPKHMRTREHLTGLLWAEKPERSARHSLREALRVLRRATGEQGITTEQDKIRLADDVVQLDTEEFERLESARDWSGAASMAVGEFLEGFSVSDASAFEDWLTTERHAWRRRIVAALTNLAEQWLDRGQEREAAAASVRALDMDSGSDAAVQSAMKSLAIAGDRAAALEQYERFTARLEEFGTEPDPGTTALAERVRRERSWRLTEAVPTAVDQGAETRRAPLVGREPELAKLLEAWHRTLKTGAMSVAVIEGDGGVGKSRLAEEVIARGRLDGAVAATVRAVEADLEHSHSGVLGLARGGLMDASGLAAAAPNALAAFAAEIAEWADRFGKHAEPAPALGAALSEVLRAVTEEQPVALLLDDAQWLDRDSLLALTAVARDLATAPVLVLFTIAAQPSRDEIDELRSRIGRDLQGVALRLRPLEPDALRALARWAVPGFSDEEVDRLARRVIADSAGLPILAVEMLHAVALGLDLGTIEGAWPAPLKTLDQTLPGELPDAVVAAIRVGFRRLSKDAQHVLSAAAVLGERVATGTLEGATGITGDVLLSALDELEWQRWLIAEPRGYTFVARIVREVVERDMLTSGQRQRIVQGAQAAR